MSFIQVDEYIEKEKLELKGPLHVTKVKPSLVNELKLQFLNLFMQCGLVEEVCVQMGISPGTVYQWRREDPYFAAEWDRVRREETVAILEDKAFKVAMGQDKADTEMLKFLLKAYKRQVYDDKFVEPDKKKDGFKIVLTDATQSKQPLLAEPLVEPPDESPLQHKKTEND